VRAAQVDEHQPALDLPPQAVGQHDLRHRRQRILEHLDEADPAVGRAQLILNAGLQLELLGFDPVRQGGDLVRGAAARRQHVQRTEQRHGDGGGGAGRTPGWAPWR
jgi:hypothetical protein